jgi:hypothetical protein
MTSRLGPLALVITLTVTEAARAQTPPAEMPPAAPPPATAAQAPLPPPAAPFPLDAWLIRYQAARQRFFAGEFEQASRELLALAAVAPDPTSAFAARELGVMAAEWHRRGLSLAPRGAAGKLSSGRDRSHRTSDEIASLYGYSVAYGIGTGLWLASLNEPDSAAGLILPSLALAGGSAGLVAYLDRGKGMGYGVPQSIQAGLTLGFLQGVFWTSWNQARVRYDEEWEFKTVTTLIWGASTTGAMLGGVLGAHYGTTPGRASFVSSAGLWTGTVGGLVAAALTPDERDSARDDNGLLVAALGLNAGAALGVWQAKEVSPSIARVRFIDLGGVAGALLGGGLYLAANDKNPSERGLLGVTAAGMAGGLGLAFQLTKSMEPDRPEEDPPAVDARASITPTRGGLSLGFNGSW